VIADCGSYAFSIDGASPEISWSTISCRETSAYDYTDVNFELFDLTGTLVKNLYTYKIGKGQHTIPLHFDGLPDGIYFIRGTPGHTTDLRKLILHSL